MEVDTGEPQHNVSTHWSRVMHICVSKLTIISSDDGLSPARRQAIIWINAGILLNVPLGTNFSEISIEIYKFSLKKMHLKMGTGGHFFSGLNALNYRNNITETGRLSGWLSWLSLETLKLDFKVSNDEQDSRPDDLSVSVKFGNIQSSSMMTILPPWICTITVMS